jgi:CTP:molybdopterin cytidylyltransferase MocA
MRSDSAGHARKSAYLLNCCAAQNMNSIDVIIPAAGTSGESLERATGIKYKALIPLGDRTLLNTAISTALELPGIRRIVVIGPPEVQAHAKKVDGVEALPSIGSAPENILQGLKLISKGESEKAVILTSDLPFNTSSIVEAFLAEVEPDAEFALPLVTQADFDRTFPGTRSTFVRLKESPVTLGGVFVVDEAAFTRSQQHLEQVFQARKSKFKMAKLLGAPFIIKLLTNRLSLEEISVKIESTLDCRGQAVLGADARLGFDIDGLREWQYATEYLSRHDIH